MLVGLKSRVISRNLGLYGFKFGKLTASVEDFSGLIPYNYVDLLQFGCLKGIVTAFFHRVANGKKGTTLFSL
jgi:hypothetical protein